MSSIVQNSLATDKPVSVREAARHFGIDPSTIRREIQRGCPVLCRGSRGPGRGARLDVNAVEQWRRAQGRGRASGPTGLTPDEVLQRIAVVLLDSLNQAHVDVRAGISREAAAAALLVVWERCCESFGISFRFDGQPAPICALMRLL